MIGSPEGADVIFTAHYDTPRRALIPNLMLPLNPVLKWIYIFLPVLAMLAGRAVGLWTDGDLRNLQSVDREFIPAMDERQRAQLLRHWHRAVERSKGWAEE